MFYKKIFRFAKNDNKRHSKQSEESSFYVKMESFYGVIISIHRNDYVMAMSIFPVG